MKRIWRKIPHAGTLLVAGSVGPYGAYLADGSEYRGDYVRRAEEFTAFHRPRIEALLDAGADLLACETRSSFEEIKALAALVAEYPKAPGHGSCFTLRDSEHLSRRDTAAGSCRGPERYSQVVALGIKLYRAGKHHRGAETPAQPDDTAAGGLSELGRAL